MEEKPVSEKHERGLDTRRAVMGEAYIKKSLQSADEVRLADGTAIHPVLPG